MNVILVRLITNTSAYRQQWYSSASAPSCVNTPEAFLLLPFVAGPAELHTEIHTLFNKEVQRNIFSPCYCAVPELTLFLCTFLHPSALPPVI